LKSDLLKELERQRNLLNSYRGNPSIAEEVLDEVIDRIEQAFRDLNALQGKAGSTLLASDWLMSVRSRINIPGGTCEFDLPAYYAWQQRPAGRRQADLAQWMQGFLPLEQALDVLLGLLRQSGVPHKVVAPNGQFQQSLPSGRTYQLMRVKLNEAAELIPEITGHRLMVSVRLMRQDGSEDYRVGVKGSEVELQEGLEGQDLPPSAH
jgi:cell division protein ZapD